VFPAFYIWVLYFWGVSFYCTWFPLIYILSCLGSHTASSRYFILFAIYKHYCINVLFCLLKIYIANHAIIYCPLTSDAVDKTWRTRWTCCVPFLMMGKMSFYIHLAHGDRYYKSHRAWKQQNEITSQHPAAVVSLFFLATSYILQSEKQNQQKRIQYTPPCTNLWRQKRGNVSSNSVTINQKTPCACALQQLEPTLYLLLLLYNIDLFNAICYAGRAYIFLFLLYTI
jgi:hypothetical protein